MRTAIFLGKEKVGIQDRPVPNIQGNEALVAVKACGICGTDVHALVSGDLYPQDTVFGHECAGIVTEVGAEVSDVRVGDRVVVAPAPPCGSCIHCRSGRDNLCAAHLERDMGSAPDRPGACAEFVRVIDPERMIHPLPESVTFEQGALVEPLAVAFHGVRQSRLCPGEDAVVLGAGPIGLGVIQFLKLSGAGRIVVLELSRRRADLALRFGADVTLNPVELGEGAIGKVRRLTHRHGAAVVFECTGVPRVFRTASHYARGGGRVVAIGVLNQEASLDALDLLTREIELRGSMCYTAEEFRMVLDFIEKGRIEAKGMISDVISLEDLADPSFPQCVRADDTVKIIVKP